MTHDNHCSLYETHDLWSICFINRILFARIKSIEKSKIEYLPLVLYFSQGIQPKVHHESTLTPFLYDICFKTEFWLRWAAGNVAESWKKHRVCNECQKKRNIYLFFALYRDNQCVNCHAIRFLYPKTFKTTSDVFVSALNSVCMVQSSGKTCVWEYSLTLKWKFIEVIEWMCCSVEFICFYTMYWWMNEYFRLIFRSYEKIHYYI